MIMSEANVTQRLCCNPSVKYNAHERVFLTGCYVVDTDWFAIDARHVALSTPLLEDGPCLGCGLN